MKSAKFAGPVIAMATEGLYHMGLVYKTVERIERSM